jgi:hypothetical protein
MKNALSYGSASQKKFGEKFCEQYVNHSLGSRHRSGLWLLMVAGTARAACHLHTRNAGRVGKMFTPKLGRIKSYDIANFCCDWIAWRVHRGGGPGAVFDFY